MAVDQKQLVSKLVEQQLLPSDKQQHVINAAQKNQQSLEDYLLANKLVDGEALAQVKAELLNIPYADLRDKKISNEVLNTFTQEIAENYKFIAFERDQSTLKVGMLDPQDFKAVEAVEFVANEKNLNPQYYVISQESFDRVSRMYSALVEEAKEVLENVGEQARFTERVPDVKVDTKEDLEKVIKSAPVAKMVLVILKHAQEGRASDIHIEPDFNASKVRYRIDGLLRVSLVLPKYIHSAIVSRIKVLANLKLDETRKPQDGRIRLAIDDKMVDFRVSTLPVAEGEKVVLRILDASKKVPTLEELGFNAEFRKIILDQIKKPHGLILLTGPTGSGKTTTLYTILQELNNEDTNIITLEDPIEYYMEGVNQSQVRPEIGYSFASGLRSILRQDPNVIMLGEIRDNESAELVIHSSLTGHMVFSTLHTNDAVGAIPRLIDMEVEPFLLGSTLRLVISQRLARRICTQCKTKAKLPAKTENQMIEVLGQVPPKYLVDAQIDKPLTFWKGDGCNKCGGTGYKGRVAVAEIVVVTDQIKEDINKEDPGPHVREHLKQQNFLSLMQDGVIKALRGDTTVDEVLRISQL
ncbi:MAG: hypothetical protein COT81_03755 [Candidatus Buchananbacteria bacterium CG10_big_fil_rev_8_21_14_0_10_42_9]|uniref:AAA+ ATPase domain-containing protein n=1 Tax=Candidatus Buchananbacteria bacterium CG10_big_fil_rev_8_21_14_0_10_42_9 TaxID=1974526 RepID=A0A2H0W350_9BACT|nr:MAG: hypothetical protein COT81_03755 [Candidatus Buchananbacteria bacterium CG10_big_fil_rev_8_21_14_0_10_42_9]